MRTVGCIDTPGVSTSIAVNVVACGGVLSGEWIATLFFLGLGEVASSVGGVVLSMMGVLFICSGAISMGDDVESSDGWVASCCCVVGIGLGIVYCFD